MHCRYVGTEDSSASPAKVLPPLVPVQTVPLVPRFLLACPHCGASWTNLVRREDTEQHCIVCGWSGWSRPPRDTSAFEVMGSELADVQDESRYTMRYGCR